jgi:glycosyltransferase involved in cell wall biosynthesis
MRIVHVSSWFQPKLGYSEFHLPKAQAKRGHTVSVVTSDRFFPFPDYEHTVGKLLGPRIVGDGDFVVEGVAVLRLRVLFEIRHHMWLVGLPETLERFRPEVIHLHEAFTLPVLQCAQWARRNGVPLLIASSMEREVFREMDVPRRCYYGIHKRIVAPLIRKANVGFAAVGPGAQEILAEQMGISFEKVEVVPLGADSDRFRFDERQRSAIRLRLGIGSDCVLIIYAGKIIEEKDVHVLAEAVARARNRSKIVLLLVGEGKADYKARISDTLEASAVRCIFEPPVPNGELPAYFSASDLGVWPSQSSNAAVEAALVGLPLIVSDVRATKHYIAAGNGLAFSRGDIAGLSELIQRLVDGKDEREQMSDLGKKHLGATMTWDAISQRYVEIYQRLIGAAHAHE